MTAQACYAYSDKQTWAQNNEIANTKPSLHMVLYATNGSMGKTPFSQINKKWYEHEVLSGQMSAKAYRNRGREAGRFPLALM